MEMNPNTFISVAVLILDFESAAHSNYEHYHMFKFGNAVLANQRISCNKIFDPSEIEKDYLNYTILCKD